MRIQHNIMAMSAYRNYTNNVSAMKKNLEKLSSGYKINRAGDDAAGLAISEKMRAQITGLETAQKNAKDGISLVQTAEGALTEVHDMLNRMVELATQSANGTYDNETDREQLQKEVNQLTEEINRIADSSNFNGIKLLDGSMDAEGVVHGTGNDGNPTNFTIPAEGALGVGTVLHADASAAGGTGTEFSVDLHNITFDNRVVGNKLTLNIGGKALTLEVTTAGTAEKMDSKAIADAFAAGTAGNYKVTWGTTELNATTKVTLGANNDQKFTMTASGAADTGKLTFKQDAAPTKAADVVSGDMTVSITASIKTPASVSGTAETAKVVDGKAASAIFKQKITTVTLADGNTFTVGGTTYTAKTTPTAGVDTEIDITTINDATKMAAFIASKVTTSGDYNVTATGDELIYTAKTPGKFGSGADESGPDAAPTAVAVAGGTGTITLATMGTTPTTDGTEASTDAKDQVTMSAASLNTAEIAKAAVAAGVTADQNITVKADQTSGKLELYAGTTKIGEATAAIADGTTSYEIKTTDAAATSLGSITLTKGANANALAKTMFTNSVDTGLDFKAVGAAQSQSPVDYNVSTTDILNKAVGSNERLASTVVTVTADMFKHGASITIGKETYTFSTDAKNPLTGTNVVDLSDLKSTGDNYISDALTRLTDKAAGNSTYTVGHSDTNKTKFTVTEKKGQADYVENGKSALTSVEAIAKTLSYTGKVENPTAGKALTLQIGDTADEFNKLKVNIKDMHADSLGIGKDQISILDQDKASSAVKAIKDAINKVSDLRGTLGANQNRLEHTINNLAVMTENIQDAESTIRDVDVAEEMMAYTKNNILIQSAQAMLAQANQVPQGVLQLLQ